MYSPWAMTPFCRMNMHVNPSTVMSWNSGVTGNRFFSMGMANFGQFAIRGKVMDPTKEVRLSKCVLYPPKYNVPPPKIRTKPLGCKTVFVGGLPENATEEMIKEMFERCGEISFMYKSGQICYVRFASEAFVNNAVYFSGYRMTIGNDKDSRNTGNLCVNYVQTQADQYEYECWQRSFQRRVFYVGNLGSSSVLPYSDQGADMATKKLKSNEIYQEGLSVLITWLETGTCNKRNCERFYFMIQNANCIVGLLMNEKFGCECEMGKAKAMFEEQMQNIVTQFNEVSKILDAASRREVWCHFTSTEKRKLEFLKKRVENSKNSCLEELLNDESDVSSSDSDVVSVEEKFGSKDELEFIKNAKEERDSLKCQLEGSENEYQLLLANSKQDKYEHEQQMQSYRQTMQRELERKRTEQETELQELRSYKLSRAVNNRDGPSNAVTSSSNIVARITYEEGFLIALISAFMSVHDNGVSMDYLSSYVQNFNKTARAREIEALMKKFPDSFKEITSGVGASLSKTWTLSLRRDM